MNYESSRIQGTYGTTSFSSAALGAEAQAPVGGLLLLAERVAEATQRVLQVSAMLDQIALGIHGPRPAEVQKSVGEPTSDSLRSRIDGLLMNISRLESSAQSIAH